MRVDGRRLRLAGSEFIDGSRAIKIDWEDPPAILLSIHDITEAVRAKEALRQNEERFRNFFENAASGMVILDLEGRILQAGRAEYTDLSRTEGRRVNREAILGDHRLERGGETVVDLGRIHEVGHIGVELRVVDMLVQVLGVNAEGRRVDHGDP